VQVRTCAALAHIANASRSNRKHLTDSVATKLKALTSYKYKIIKLLISHPVRNKSKHILGKHWLTVFYFKL
jgi:hypothetical protein